MTPLDAYVERAAVLFEDYAEKFPNSPKASLAAELAEGIRMFVRQREPKRPAK